MTIVKKLTLSYAVVLAGAGTMAGVSLWAIQNLDARFDTAVSKTSRKLQLGVELNRLKSDLYVAQRGYLLAAFMRDKTQADAQRVEFDRQIEAINQKLEEIHPLISVPEGRRLLGIFEADLATWLREYQSVLSLAQGGSVEAAQRDSIARIAPVYAEMTATADQFAEVYRRILEDDKRAAATDYRFALWMFGVSLIVLALVGGMAFLAIARMLRGLRHAVAELSEGAAQVAAAAGQVASFSQWSAHGSSQQAASLEETSASGEEINSMARKNSESSRMAAGLMTHAQETFTQANQSLDESVAAMGEINAQSERISKIIKVIDEIAFQTNILALNAAVEAARAGEAGMGFAVVAGEVRSLAQRCAQAARDTALMIEESIAKSSAGRAKVDQVASAIRAITAETAQVKTLVDEVNLGSQEQTRGIEEISKAISHMEQLTQSTAANAEETAAASQELNAQSATLRDVVQHLSALVGVVGARPMAPSFAGGSPAHLSSPDGTQRLAPSAPSNAGPRKSLPGRTKSLGGSVAGAIKIPNRGAFPLDDTFKEF